MEREMEIGMAYSFIVEGEGMAVEEGEGEGEEGEGEEGEGYYYRSSWLAGRWVAGRGDRVRPCV